MKNVISDIHGKWKLNNGVKMPYVGLGVFQSRDGSEVVNAIQNAFAAGYRLIDTAAFYDNEKGVGEAIRTSGLKRKDIFVTTKVWNEDQRTDNVLKAFEISLEKLGLEYIDLYLIHWPVKEKYVNTWHVLEELYNKGLVKSIGVSNFLEHHLEKLIKNSTIIPQVNQMEFHPNVVQQELLNYCSEKGIQYQSWSPFAQGRIFKIPLLKDLASKYGKSVTQLVLRWNLQKGVMVIPKSVTKGRIIENAQLFDFVISEEDMFKIDNLDNGDRTGAHPDHFDF